MKYILDLHGNSKKKERSPDGTKDENVFDIQQGVAIGTFVKRQNTSNASSYATVHHANLWGAREVYEQIHGELHTVGGKYYWLAEHDLSKTEWNILKPQSPFYLFTPHNIDLLTEYERGWRVVDIMPVNSTGVKTHRDHFVLDFDISLLHKRIEDFRNRNITDEAIADNYGLEDTRDWKLSARRRSLASNPRWETYFTECLYHPFDIRSYFHHEDVVELPRHEVMDQMLSKENLALLISRQVADTFKHVFVTNRIAGFNSLDTAGRFGSGPFLPLYLYPNPNKKGLFDFDELPKTPGGRHPNLSKGFINAFISNLKLDFIEDSKGNLNTNFGPEDVLDYMYAIFYSPSYRFRYSEFLKFDFPRLPLTSDVDLLRELCAIGDRLVDLHLMERYGGHMPNYPKPGNNRVEKVEYTQLTDNPDQGRVWINKTQYFDGVPSEVWEFHVGGYQVCYKWLKDRKGRQLDMNDVIHYERIVAALAETIILMEQIDEAIEEHAGWPIE